MNKRGILRVIIFMFLLAVALIVWSRFSEADSVVDIVNITLSISSSSVILNVSNSIYNYNTSNQSVFLQFNYSIQYPVNVTASANLTCSNLTVQVSCDCPSVTCPNVTATCNVDEVNLKNETKSELFNHYVTQLQSKIEESSNKVTTDLAFRLEPTRAEVEGLKQKAFNSSLLQIEAERQRDAALVIAEQRHAEIEIMRRDSRWLMATIIIEFVAIVILLGSLFGFEWIDRFRFKGY